MKTAMERKDAGDNTFDYASNVWKIKVNEIGHLKTDERIKVWWDNRRETSSVDENMEMCEDDDDDIEDIKKTASVKW